MQSCSSTSWWEQSCVAINVSVSSENMLYLVQATCRDLCGSGCMELRTLRMQLRCFQGALKVDRREELQIFADWPLLTKHLRDAGNCRKSQIHTESRRLSWEPQIWVRPLSLRCIPLSAALCFAAKSADCRNSVLSC